MKYTLNYPMVVNETDTHYEVVIYDFNSPNIYPSGYLAPFADTEIDGDLLRVYAEKYGDDYLNILVEGYGMMARMKGGNTGGDLLSPRLKGGGGRGGNIPFSIYYVRNQNGDVLLYDSSYKVWTADDECIELGDPYDIDFDGSFDIGDINRLINIMLHKQSDDPYKSADVNFDLAVDIEDLNMYLNRMLSGVKAVDVNSLLVPKAE